MNTRAWEEHGGRGGGVFEIFFLLYTPPPPTPILTPVVVGLKELMGFTMQTMHTFQKRLIRILLMIKGPLDACNFGEISDYYVS